MTPEILAAIISLCLGSPDTQACHAKFSKCLSDQRASVKQKDDACFTMSNGDLKQECYHEARRMDKSDHQVLIECSAN